jgi:hypothetical protein
MTELSSFLGPTLSERGHGRYAVIRFGDEWRLMYGASVIGQFPTLELASGVADKLCRAVAGVGFDVDLTVQTWAGELRSQSIPSALSPSGPAAGAA